jgi:hypothetical protein
MAGRVRSYETGQILGIDGDVCVLVLRGVETADDVQCGGQPLVEQPPPPCSVAQTARGSGPRAGDVLWDPPTGLELRCIRAGHRPLAVGNRAMVHRADHFVYGAAKSRTGDVAI